MERTPFLIWPEENSRMESSGDCADARSPRPQKGAIAARRVSHGIRTRLLPLRITRAGSLSRALKGIHLVLSRLHRPAESSVNLIRRFCRRSGKERRYQTKRARQRAKAS